MTKWFTFTPDAGAVFDSRNYAKMFVKKIHRPLMPPITTTAFKAGKRAGAYLQANTLDAYQIEIEVIFLSNTDALLRKDLRAMALKLYNNKSGKLTFSDEPDVYINCQLTGEMDWENFAAMGEGKITFQVSDPFAYKLTEVNTLFPSGAGAANLVVTVDGFETFPRFRFVPVVSGVTSFRMDNLTTGKFMLVSGTFALNTAYIIDHARNLVYQESNGARMMNTVDLASDFFPLVNGANTLKYTDTAQISTRVYFTDRYL